MKKQRMVSLTLSLSFIIMLLSSGVLYLIADRGVTDWSNWSFLGLDKQQWDNLHINFGWLFLVFLVWHIYYNWKPIKNYLKEKKKWVIFTKEFNVSLLISAIFMIGTVWMIPPVAALVNVGNAMKAKNIKDDTPPFAYAEETTLRDFCLILGINYPKAIALMNKNSIAIGLEDKTVKEIAKNNRTSPKRIYALLKPLGRKLPLPSDIPVGIGHKSLEKLADEYTIDIKRVIEHLSTYGIKISPDRDFKEIAHKNHLHPATLYGMFLASQVK